MHAATELGDGVIPDGLRARALDLLERASRRRSLSSEHTVIGFFGATGSGKSSLFNAVAGRQLARVAARRPTTSAPMAVVGGSGDGADALLDWLDVSERHQLTGGPLSAPAGRSSASGASRLVLLDLPDFDSTVAEHRRTAERLAGQVDALVFVLDPQKYADAVVHREFLAAMAGHEAVTLIVLNQIDRVSTPDRAAVLGSLRALVNSHGLDHAHLVATSATTGEGIDELAAHLARIAARREATNQRLTADLSAAVRELEPLAPSATLASRPLEGAASELSAGLAQASGVEMVTRAVARSYRQRSTAATGWPVTRWLVRFRPDPMRRLGLARNDAPSVNRTSLPQASPAARAQQSSAVRQYLGAAAEGAPEVWAEEIHRAGRPDPEAFADALDQAVAGADLRQQHRSWWWAVTGSLQWLFVALAAAGALWLLGLGVLNYLQFDVADAPRVEGFPVPTLLLIGGLLAGIVLALLCRVFTAIAARSRARRARRVLLRRLADVAQQQVIGPAAAAARRADDFRSALAKAAAS
nr:GTPase [Zhihengliuella flava]